MVAKFMFVMDVYGDSPEQLERDAKEDPDSLAGNRLAAVSLYRDLLRLSGHA